jgi:mannopine transport system permease protein
MNTGYMNAAMLRKWRPGFAVVMTTFVLVFLLIPTIIVIPVSFGSEKYLQFPPKDWSLTWYRAYFADTEWMEATKLSVIVAFFATALAACIALPLSLALVRGRIPAAGAVKALVLAPMILPHIVTAVGLYITFARWNLTGTVTGFVLAMAILCLPYLFLTLSAAVSQLEPSLDMAAASLGANRLTTFRLVTLPLLLPAILAGMAFAFITALDEAVVSNFLSSSISKTLMKKMFEDIDFDVSPIIAAVSTLIIVATLSVVGLMQLIRLVRLRRMG